MKMRDAKTIAPSAAASRRRRFVLTAGPGTRIFFLVRQMSRSAACPAPGRKKRSEQTIYDAATREVLQIEFPSRRNRSLWKLGAVTREIHTGCKIKAGRKAREFVGARMHGNYFLRNRFEISPEIERNTSTASAPIMQKAIIIFSGSA